MNRIDSYRFGKIVINDTEYKADVVIFPDKIKSNWSRVGGHELCLDDIADVISESPDVLVVGTGAFGRVAIIPEVERELDRRSIRLIAEKTGTACNTYNELSPSHRVIAALHLTC